MVLTVTPKLFSAFNLTLLIMAPNIHNHSREREGVTVSLYHVMLGARPGTDLGCTTRCSAI